MIASTADLKLLADENTRLRAELERLREQIGGDCIGCNYNDGPDECCPMHGRTLVNWMEIASEVIGRQHDRDATIATLRAELERLRTHPFDVDALAAEAGHTRYLHHRGWHFQRPAADSKGRCTWRWEWEDTTTYCQAPDVPGLGLCWAHAVQAAERTETPDATT